ncbi:MAG: HAD-IA family hydrolase [Phormidesmis sp.]
MASSPTMVRVYCTCPDNIAPSLCPSSPHYMLKAVIFDLDGTLTNSDKVHFRVFQEMFALRGISIDKAIYRKKISGRQNAAILADFLPRLSLAAREAFSGEKETTFRAIAKGKITPLPGLLPLLAQIHSQDLAAAVVTNAPPENATFMLSELGLAERFDPVILGDELAKGKPDPLPYQTALEQLGIQATEAIAFEDSPSGIRSATGAGINTIGVTTTHSAKKLISAGATAAIADFNDPSIPSLLPIDPQLS